MELEQEFACLRLLEQLISLIIWISFRIEINLQILSMPQSAKIQITKVNLLLRDHSQWIMDIGNY